MKVFRACAIINYCSEVGLGEAFRVVSSFQFFQLKIVLAQAVLRHSRVVMHSTVHREWVISLSVCKRVVQDTFVIAVVMRARVGIRL